MAISTFIPEVWVARLLANYNRNLVVAALANRNYEGEIRQYGDTVHINSLNELTVKDYTPNVKIEEPEQLTTVDQTLVIDHGKYYNFYVDDVDAVQARGDLMDAAMADAARLIAEDTEDYILEKLITDGSITDELTGALTAENVYASIVKMKVAMDEKNVPRAGRHLIVPPSVEGLMLMDNRFVTGNGAPSENRLVNGYVARAAGFDIYSSNAAVANMVAFNTESITFANQLTETEAYRPEARFADAVKGLSLCGAKVTRPDAVAVFSITGG